MTELYYERLLNNIIIQQHLVGAAYDSHGIHTLCQDQMLFKHKIVDKYWPKTCNNIILHSYCCAVNFY